MSGETRAWLIGMVWFGLVIVPDSHEVAAQGSLPAWTASDGEADRADAATLDRALDRIDSRLRRIEGGSAPSRLVASDRGVLGLTSATGPGGDPEEMAAELDRLHRDIACLRSADVAARAERSEQDGQLRAARNERDLATATATRSALEVRAALVERDRVIAVGDEVRRRMLAAFLATQIAAADREAAAQASLATLQLRLNAVEREPVPVRATALPDQPTDGRASDPAADRQEQIDMLVAERDKALDEAAASKAGLEVRLADTERRLAAMSDEVAKAWNERVSAEQRTEQVSAQADIARSQTDQLLAGERAKNADLARELVLARSRAAALDSLSTASGRHVAAAVQERDELRKVAGRAVLRTVELAERLFMSLDQTRLLSEILADARTGASLTEVDRPAGFDDDLLEHADGRVWPVAAASVVGDPTDGSHGSDRLDAPSLPVLARLTGLALEPVGEGSIRAIASGIEFAAGEAQIGDGSVHGLAQIAILLRSMPDAKADIVGHTDDQGDVAANDDLVRRRAEAVRTALIEQFEIDGSRIAADGVGATEPIASNATTEGRRANRRVEVFIAR